MTKKEIAEVELMRRELRILSALRWTEEVKPDIDYPQGKEFTKGWLVGYKNATIGCSNSVHHSSGRNDRTDSQRPVQLYSTKLLALRGLRHETERRCAIELADVDRMIEAALKQPEADNA